MPLKPDNQLDVRPIRVFPDPFRKGNNVLVLSECYKPEGNGVISPLNHLETEGTCGVNGNNSRYQAVQVFSNPKVAEQKPWFECCVGICVHRLLNNATVAGSALSKNTSCLTRRAILLDSPRAVLLLLKDRTIARLAPTMRLDAKLLRTTSRRAWFVAE